VAFFRVEEGGAVGFSAPAAPVAASRAKLAAPRHASRSAAGRPQVAGNTALKADPNWTEF